MPSGKRFLGISVTLAALALMGYGAYKRIKAKDAKDENAPPAMNHQDSLARKEENDLPIPVEGVPIVKGVLVMSVSASGVAAAPQQTRILAQAAGTILRISAREDNYVTAGQELVMLDTAEVLLDIEQIQLDLMKDSAKIKELTLFDERLRDSAVKADRLRAARLQTNLDRNLIQLKKQQATLQKARTAAPFAGVISDVKVVPGQHVSPGNELMTIAVTDPIFVEVEVLENEVGKVRIGSRARLNFTAMPDTTIVGIVRKINPVVTNTTRTARVFVEIPNRQHRILPGMYAQVRIDADRYPGRIMIPKGAVMYTTDKRARIFLFDNGRASWKYVTLGLENDSVFEVITEGPKFDPNTDVISPGQIVLTQNHKNLSHDAKIKLVDDVRKEGVRREQ
jgi:RND family efflux transporter MFP subunit